MPKIFLIPNFISSCVDTIPPATKESITHIRLFFVEEAKAARVLLKHIDANFPLQACRFHELNEHTKPSQLKEYVQLLNEDAGIISESGCPCVADPGADLVLSAHQQGIEICPLAGPSSILLALMASGLGGQCFAFNGYLPKDGQARIKRIKDLEGRSLKEGQTQVIMETPYRNQALLQDLLQNLHSKTLLSVACDVTGPQQMIKTQSVLQWQKSNISLPKTPALFILKRSLSS